MDIIFTLTQLYIFLEEILEIVTRPPLSTLQSRIYSAGHDSDLYWLEAKAAAAVLQTDRGRGWAEAGPSQGWKTLLQLSQGGELRKRSLLAVQIIFLIYYIIDNFFCFLTFLITNLTFHYLSTQASNKPWCTKRNLLHSFNCFHINEKTNFNLTDFNPTFVT